MPLSPDLAAEVATAEVALAARLRAEAAVTPDRHAQAQKVLQAHRLETVVRFPVVSGRIHQGSMHSIYRSLGVAQTKAREFAERHPSFNDVVVVQLPSRAFTVGRLSVVEVTG